MLRFELVTNVEGKRSCTDFREDEFVIIKMTSLVVVLSYFHVRLDDWKPLLYKNAYMHQLSTRDGRMELDLTWPYWEAKLHKTRFFYANKSYCWCIYKHCIDLFFCFIHTSLWICITQMVQLNLGMLHWNPGLSVMSYCIVLQSVAQSFVALHLVVVAWTFKVFVKTVRKIINIVIDNLNMEIDK